jgi:hypothetical protein
MAEEGVHQSITLPLMFVVYPTLQASEEGVIHSTTPAIP